MNNVNRFRVSICRNVKDYKFVPKLTQENKQEIINKITAVLQNFNFAQQNEQDTKTLNKFYGSTYNKNQVMLNKTADVAIKFFDNEHITITACDFGYNKDVYKRATNVAGELKNKIAFAYLDEYGYLTSNLNLIGNGLKLECEFNLCGICKLGKISQVKANVQKLGYNLIETNEENVFTLCTKCNLGFAQSEVFAEFDKMVQRLQQLETDSCKILASDKEDEMYDNFVRSLAILKNVHIISFEELKLLTEQLRIGLNLGYNEVDETKVLNLQQLISNNNSQFVSKSEHIALAKKVKEILK